MYDVDVKVYFNFRSPYCYLASKTMWQIFDNFHANLVWRPVGGWHLRSQPSRAKKKMPLARQDMARFARRLGIPVNPPPADTEPTPAGAGSLYAEERGRLREYIVEMMRIEWVEGKDIADSAVIREVARRIGLDPDAVEQAATNTAYLERLESNFREADEEGVIGVPSFVIGDEIFWGQDRIEFVVEKLMELRAAKL